MLLQLTKEILYSAFEVINLLSVYVCYNFLFSGINRRFLLLLNTISPFTIIFESSM